MGESEPNLSEYDMLCAKPTGNEAVIDSGHRDSVIDDPKFREKLFKQKRAEQKGSN